MKYDQDNRQDHDSDLNPFNDPDLQQFDKHLDEEEARIRDEEEEISGHAGAQCLAANRPAGRK